MSYPGGRRDPDRRPALLQNFSSLAALPPCLVHAWTDEGAAITACRPGCCRLSVAAVACVRSLCPVASLPKIHWSCEMERSHWGLTEDKRAQDQVHVHSFTSLSIGMLIENRISCFKTENWLYFFGKRFSNLFGCCHFRQGGVEISTHIFALAEIWNPTSPLADHCALHEGELYKLALIITI